MKAPVQCTWPRKTGKRSSRTAPTCSSKVSSCFATSSSSRNGATGSPGLRIRPWSGEHEHQVDFGEPTYMARVGSNPELNTNNLRYIYTSMTTPMSSYDYDMTKRSKTLVKREEVLGGFRPGELRHRAAARDCDRRHEGPDLDRLQEGISQGRHQAAFALRIWLLWREHGRIDFSRSGSACSTEVSPMRSPTSGAARNWDVTWYEERQTLEETEHVHGFHRVRPAFDQRGIYQARAPVRPGGECRRAADGGRRST